MKLPPLEPLSARYKRILADPEMLGEGPPLDTVCKLLVTCESTGRAEGAFQMLEELAPFLTPGARAIGKVFFLKLKAKSDALLGGSGS
ncbi:MAG TPA: hypothetical protein VGB13_04615 [Candidatus Krumholzibacteria bacterium]